jgi:hypothetical protein
MKDPTEGLEMVYDDSIGRLYTARDLMALAQQAATELGTTENGYRIKVSNADVDDVGRQFWVSILGASNADLLIEVESSPVRGKASVRRTFTYRPSKSLPARSLEPLELDSDSSGGQTASIEGKPLDTQGIINETITPLRIAVGDIPDA